MSLNSYEQKAKQRTAERIKAIRSGADMDEHLRSAQLKSSLATADALLPAQARKVEVSAPRALETPELDAAVGNDTPQLDVAEIMSVGGAGRKGLSAEEQAKKDLKDARRDSAKAFLGIFDLLDPERDKNYEEALKRQRAAREKLDEVSGTTWAERFRESNENALARIADMTESVNAGTGSALAKGAYDVSRAFGLAGGEDAVNKSPFDNLLDTSDVLSEQSQAKGQKAIEGAGTGGRLALQAYGAGYGMLSDLATGAPTASMMIRTYGNASQAAREKGYNEKAQAMLGLQSAATEYLSEKLFGGNPVYDSDAGLVNRIVGMITEDERVINFLASQPVEVINEGLEELVSGYLGPLGEALLTGKEVDWPTVQQMAEDFIVGTLLGGASTVASNIGSGKWSGGEQTAPVQEQTSPLIIEQQEQTPPLIIEQEQPTQQEQTSPLIVEQEQMQQDDPAPQSNPMADALLGEEQTAQEQVPPGQQSQQQGTAPFGGEVNQEGDAPSDFAKSTEGQPGGTERTSQTPETVRNSRVTTEEMRDVIDRKGAEGDYNYWAITNDETVQRASETIASEGWDTAYANWVKAVHNGRAGDQITAIGAILYNHALSAGNKDLASDILGVYQEALRNTARGLQAGKIIQNLSPDSRLYMIERSISRYAADMGVPDDIVLSDELKQAYRNAKTEQERNAVIAQMQKEVAAQLPTSLMEKWTALRYVNMLGNFKTQLRNIGGNVTSRGLSGMKNAVRTFIESMVYSKNSGKRTSSYFVGKDYMDAGRSDFRDTMKDAVMDGGKYSDTSPRGFMRGVQENKRIFVNPLLEGYRKATNWAMETGDRVFSEEAYARAVAGWMKAKGVSAEQFRAMLEAEKNGGISAQDSKRLSDARMFAMKEAQEITFRDDNAFSNWISKIGRRKDTPKAARVLAEGALPFRKTPANVLVRAVEYSPIGIVDAAHKLVQSRKAGSDITGADVINSLSKSLTGTGLFLLGAALKNAGWLTGGEDDQKQDAFNDLRGEQAWSLFLPDGTSFTLDWASSIAFPLFMGAEFASSVGDDGVQWADLDDAMLSIVDPLMEFSMMQGINDTLDSVKYSDNNLIQLAAQTAVGYLTQGLTNSMLGQFERSTETGRKETYVDKDSGIPAWVQRSIGKASAKTPGWDYQQVDYVDSWGRTQDYENPGANFVNQLFNPSYVSSDRSTAVDDELQRLYDSGLTSVFPQRFNQSDTITTYDADGNSTGTRYLTAEEYEQFNKTMGQTRLEMTEALMNDEVFSGMSDVNKEKLIRDIYSYGKAKALLEVEPNTVLDGWMEEAMEAEDPISYIAVRRGFSAATSNEKSRDYDALDRVLDTYASLPEGEREAVSDGNSLDDLYTARDAGVSAKTWYAAKDALAAATDGEKPAYHEMYSFLNEYGRMSDEQKAVLHDNSTLEKIYNARKARVSVESWFKANKAAAAAGEKTYQKIQGVLDSVSPREADVLIPQYFESELLPLKYDMARDHGYSAQEFIQAYEACSTIESDYKNGVSMRNVQAKIVAHLVSLGWTKAQATQMYKLINAQRTTLNEWRW